jgi:hypothetical protein
VQELTGNDEWAARGITTGAALAVLRGAVTLSCCAGAGDRVEVEDLAAADRDRLLAAVYGAAFGNIIQSTEYCSACGERFDVRFPIEDLASAVDRAADARAARLLPDGVFETAAGLRFRLPSARDEMAAAELPERQAAEFLASRCVVESPEGLEAAQAVEEAIEDAAPLIDLDIKTSCPECGAAQAVHFDIQFYLLRALEMERPRMLREIHRIATAYGWSLAEILSLRRSERRTLSELIEDESSLRRRPA